MRSNPYQTYIQDDVLTADPVKLVQMLYQGAIDAIANARVSLTQRDIRARSGFISTSIEVLTELSSSLDHEKGGELSARLAALYDYAQRRLIEANQTQEDAPLAEVERLLQTLQEAWMSIETPAEMKDSKTEISETAASKANAEKYVPLSCSY